MHCAELEGAAAGNTFPGDASLHLFHSYIFFLKKPLLIPLSAVRQRDLHSSAEWQLHFQRFSQRFFSPALLLSFNVLQFVEASLKT